MSRETDKLSNTQIKNAKAREKAYKLFDGEGLYVEVTPKGAKYWRLKYRFGGKEKSLSFGVYYDNPNNVKHVSLKDARKKRDEAREQLHEGYDPAELRRKEKLAKAVGVGNSFAAVADEWYQRELPHWSKGHAVRVERFIKKYLNPSLGKRHIAEITPLELLQTLRKKESEGAVDTAHRVKQTAGLIFRFAVATGRAERDPSQDLKGALAKPVESHFSAILDKKELGVLLRAIDAYSGGIYVKTALQLTPLLFCRPGELRHMEWSELDLDKGLWEIPAEKMKMKLPHVVPLSDQALELIKEIKLIESKSKYVFPSPRDWRRPMSDNGVRTALRALGYSNDQITPHGFRSIARTLLDEELGYRVDWIEHQLAHAVKDTNGRAYNRTTHLNQRVEMMQAWADYLDSLK
ncbi:integrase [Oleiphilus sp. HI0125]|uniref:tyrosine-type recombinase/integrase n=1 Tax=Oleiphilus sp. HI0125 TaxID=1822266 RepID=UPI0007C363EA|nr:integrase arm-type DNA-binding domain-containing protein [Oleiphilus sp. HI0125]KZZ58873.1 integrase [Oleiphilus sp. HI0125]